ncbi:MAG: hypothetical protein HY606_05285 [Planctomycetes bacterium]|nr:hypothetical protein [Planctomycetota bacterium]
MKLKHLIRIFFLAIALTFSFQIAGAQSVPPQALRVSAGLFHTLVMTTDGKVRSFGANFNGQLGDGTYTDRNAPVIVPGITSPSP